MIFLSRLQVFLPYLNDFFFNNRAEDWPANLPLPNTLPKSGQADNLSSGFSFLRLAAESSGL